MSSIEVYKRIISFVAKGKMSMFGAIVVSILLPVLLSSLVFDALGLIENPYFGFLLYVVMLPLLVLGIVLLVLGSLFFPSREDIGAYTVEYLQEQFTRPGRYTRIRRHLYFTVAITLFFVIVVGVASYTSYQYTSSSQFCGLFCHNVMAPQYTAYKNSPHSRVSCVQCHLGKDADLAERSKFTGLKQLLAVAADSYPRPILSPIKALRPGRKTCEQCHLPEKFHGSRLYTKEHFRADEKNTRVRKVILMKVGSGDIQGTRAHGIHWHVSEAQQVFYRTADHDRNIVTEVRQREEGKKDVVYVRIHPEDDSTVSASDNPEKSGLRLMDCVDCHNRPTHIFLSASQAIDSKLSDNTIPAYLPFIKRQALAAMTKDYPSQEVARVEISRALLGWYRANYSEMILNNPDVFERAIQGVVQAYNENVYPEMHVSWGTYKNNLGHQDGLGCFRCHGTLREVKTGKVISRDCELCHIISAEGKESSIGVQTLQDIIDSKGGRNVRGKQQ